MSGESFGMNPYRLARGPQRESKNSDKAAKDRIRIEDNFLEEDDEDIDNSIRVSKESGEIDPRLWK
jgi:hypothetical protein